MNDRRRSEWGEHEPIVREAIERYQRFMALKATAAQLHKRMTGAHDMTPGINWGSSYDGRGKHPASSKSDMAEAYARKIYFEPGALEILEREFGTRRPA